jgi:signal transduction histidine kinase
MKDVFICHAHEDKRSVVLPLVESFQSHGITYWFDEAEIMWGDSLIEKVNEGLENSKFVIVILSMNFISKNWPKRELNAALNIEASKGCIKILPLVYGSNQEREIIIEKFPILNDKLFLYWEGNPNPITDSLKRRLSDKGFNIDVVYEKYQSLNLFIGKLVHDIRNPLSTLMARIDFVRNLDVQQRGSTNALMHEIDLLDEQANRLALVLEKAESLQPHSEEEPVATDLLTIIERAAIICNIHRPCRNVHVELNILDNLPMVKCHEARLERAFYEIFKNALEAVGEIGKVEVTANFKDIEKRLLCIKIKDTGSGIPPENITKIFDPFYTTKKGIKGAGLGLSIAYASIVQERGRIEVKSKLGSGTEIIVYLPLDVE